MGVSNKQIGWSTESNLIWNALKELDKLNKVTGSSMSSIVASLATKITNEQGVPSFYSDTLVNIPPAGTVGRMFVSTDTFAFYRDNGIGWDLIGGPGTGTITGSGAAGQVAFWNGTSSQTGSADFTWDNTAKVLSFSNGGTLTNEIRISSINTNTFFGRTAGISNNTGNINTFIGVNAGFSNTSGSNNTLIGSSTGFSNLTAGSLVCIGVNAGFNLTSGDSNVFIGRESGRWIADGVTSLTTSSTSILIGRGSRANSNGQTNQIVIGANAIGLGSNTTVIGNSSTTFGRWWGNLLIGTSTNSTFALDVAGTARVTPPANSTALTLSGYSLTGANEQPAIDISGTWNTTGTPTLIRANVTNTASNASSLLMDLRVGNVSQFSISLNGSIGFSNASSILISGTTPSDSRLIIRGGQSGAVGSVPLISLTTNANLTSTSGNPILVSISRDFVPTSGNATYTLASISATINQTGGANGITRGLFVDPTLTAAADWRSIEWSNSTGRGLWGTGTANNAMAGALHVGSATNANAAAILEITSTTRGVLFPRMTSAQRNAIATPPAGLVVYNTTDNRLSVFNGTGWVNIDTL